MDTTPSPKMFEAMQKLVESTLGQEPSRLDHSRAARQSRDAREQMMNVLHGLVSLSMREGVNRAVLEARARKEGAQYDAEDRSARDKARDDAVAGRGRVRSIN